MFAYKTVELSPSLCLQSKAVEFERIRAGNSGSVRFVGTLIGLFHMRTVGQWDFNFISPTRQWLSQES
jgi:hypothetical protein